MLEKNKSNDKLSNLIYQGTRLKETNLYLHNLDLRAKNCYYILALLYERCDFFESGKRSEKQ